MARVYLETSFFSACVTTRTDVESAFWRRCSLEWLKTQRRRHEVFISSEVIAELSIETFVRSQEALEFTVGIGSVPITAEVLGLARVLVDEKVMPGPSLAGDAVHVAAATFHGIEYLLSWNVKHLANENKKTHLANVCLKVGRVPPAIVTPELLWEAEYE